MRTKLQLSGLRNRGLLISVLSTYSASLVRPGTSIGIRHLTSQVWLGKTNPSFRTSIHAPVTTICPLRAGLGWT
ncbi:hypothetical protein F4804DRAFT_282256 [Jackrogersella minutella]|nr:hypothetical protein F4804DRAFT_282256 [Jackrogersella minutella]